METQKEKFERRAALSQQLKGEQAVNESINKEEPSITKEHLGVMQALGLLSTSAGPSLTLKADDNFVSVVSMFKDIVTMLTTPKEPTTTNQTFNLDADHGYRQLVRQSILLREEVGTLRKELEALQTPITKEAGTVVVEKEPVEKVSTEKRVVKNATNLQVLSDDTICYNGYTLVGIPYSTGLKPGLAWRNSESQADMLLSILKQLQEQGVDSTKLSAIRKAGFITLEGKFKELTKMGVIDKEWSDLIK